MHALLHHKAVEAADLRIAIHVHESRTHILCHRLGLFKLRGQGVGITKGIICQKISTARFCNSSTIVADPTGEGVAFHGCNNGSVQQEAKLTLIFLRPPLFQIASGSTLCAVDFKSDMDLLHVSNLIAVCIHIPPGGIRRVSSYRFCDFGNPAAENIACAGGYTVKCGSLGALGYGCDLVGEDLFIFYTVGVGDGVLRLKRGFLQANFSNQLSIQLYYFLGIQVDCYSV